MWIACPLSLHCTYDISPASVTSPPGESSSSTTSTLALQPHHHTGEPTLMVDGNDEGELDDNDDVVSDERKPEHDPHEHEQGHWRLCAPVGLRFFAGHRRGRRHAEHGSRSGSGSPCERSTSPHQQHQGQRQQVAAGAAAVSTIPISGIKRRHELSVTVC
jgi:hypothetical protein